MGAVAWTDTDREITRLAVPALGALVAEPLYVLADTAVVGHLGTPELGGLAVAGQTLLTFHAVMIFLAYGTTAAVSRLLGAGREREAAVHAVQGMWIALGAGVVGGAVLWIVTDPLLELLGAGGEILEHGRTYLRVSLFGLPAMLMILAAVGYLRGMQDTMRPLVVALATAVVNLVLELVLIFGFGFGIGASALSTVVAQWAGAAVFAVWVGGAVAGHDVSFAPSPALLRRQLTVAGDLFVRTAALRGSFTVGVAAAARIGPTDLAAHEITFQLWSFVALALDAIAIAGQAMIGRFLGAGDLVGARRVGDRMVRWGLVAGLVATVVILLSRPALPHLFSGDDAVIALTAFLIVHLALMQPVNGVVFALDGILIGAGDMRFLAWAMIGAAAVFVPLALSVPALDLGVGWLWGAIWALMLARAAVLLLRFRSDAWLVAGAER